MEDEDKKKLLEQLPVLSEEMELTPVIQHLLSQGIITPDNAETARNCGSSKLGRERLVFVVRKRGPRAFQVFCDALVYAKQPHLAKLLKPDIETGEIPRGLLLGLPQARYSTELKGELEALLQPRDEPDIGIPTDFDEAGTYRNFSKPKGQVLIINNKDFRHHNVREGTDVDKENLKNLFKNRLGYQVHTEDNLTAPQMEEAVRGFTQRNDHGDSCILVVLSHGELGYILGVDDGRRRRDRLSVDTLTSYFYGHSARQLIGKPKIIIMQACRGDVGDPGVFTRSDGVSEIVSSWKKNLCRCFKIDDSTQNSEYLKDGEKIDAAIVQKIPVTADIIIGYACCPGFCSFRRPTTGSWYIQTLCEVFNAKCEGDSIQHMFTEINGLVAENFESLVNPPTDPLNEKKQMPYARNFLRKKFYFYPRCYQ